MALQITSQLSKRIVLLNSLCMILIVMMHCVVPVTCNVDHYAMIVISKNITRMAVPLFFVISAVLFFRDFSTLSEFSWSLYAHKIRRRFMTLVVPYLLTVLIYATFFYCSQKIPYLRAFYPPEKMIENQSLMQIVWSINPALWFLRNLFFAFCLSPVFLLLYEKRWLAIPLFIASFFWWLTRINIYAETVFFISLGLLIARYPQYLHKTICKRTEVIVMILFFASVMSRIYLLGNYWNDQLIYLILLLKVEILSSIVLAYRWIVKLPKYAERILELFAKYSFYTYLMHMLILHVSRNICIKFLPPPNILSYILILSTTIIIAIYSYKLLLHVYRPFLSVLLGNRLKK
ncbi:acyltransferase [uncultured Phocaeicola sp.]|uniref:acyltransferase family protein n=2 Tax=uncultured Phocaeicola sp. TaxID=990718 RepID=UPI002615B68A|nr:acyltransferase [uncultured Phocaeicola sp.]